MIKIGILADIHSNYSALKSVMEDSSDCSYYILLGDIVGYNGQSTQCLRLLHDLQSEGMILASTRGNHDHAILNADLRGFNTDHGKDAVMKVRNSLDWNDLQLLNELTSSPEVDTICDITNDILNKYISVNHCLINQSSEMVEYVNIYPDNFSELVDRDPGKLLYLVGHSHLQFYHQDESGQILLNPGSVGQSRSGVPKAHYAVIHLKPSPTEFLNIHLRSVDYDIDSVVESNLELGVDQFISQRLYLGI